MPHSHPPHQPNDSTPARPHRNPLKAYENPDFLHSASGRHVRFMCEFIEPRDRLRMHHIRNTIVFFGSARTLPADVAQEKLIKAKADAAHLPAEEAKQLLEKAERAVETSEYYEAARELAGSITRWSLESTPSEHRFHICSGGGPGIMEAANRGALEAGGKTLGLGISLPYEQENNAYISPGLGFEFHYFFIRKYWFFYLAKAMVIFPGGFGTMDEMFELFTLVQTKKTQKKIPIILYGRKFWEEILNFDAFLRWGMIDENDLKVFRIVDSVREAHDYIQQQMTELYIKPGHDRDAHGDRYGKE